jgi:N-acylneuraminate cytidylyltransferase
MANICYIQARGGSKRFPGKNITPWNGIPMIADAISKARHSNLFHAVYVSSDDDEILDIARKNGAVPVKRSAENSTDTATDTDVAFEVLSPFCSDEIQYVMKLYPCVPLLTEYDIRGAFDILRLTNSDGIYSIDKDGVDAGAFYIFKLSSFFKYRTISLGAFPWIKYTLDVCQDINYPEDLESAKRKAGL